MTLKRKYVIFAVFIHAILITLSILVFKQNKYIFAAAEILILCSMFISYTLYQAFLKPLNILAAGVESMKDKDFSITFAETGQAELDALIDTYNRMITQLRIERIKQREQHYFLERLVRATPLGVIILDLDNLISMINPAAAAIFHVASDDCVGRPLQELIPESWTALDDMTAGESRIVEINGFQTYKCTKSHFLDRGFKRHFIVFEELTREILASQKRAYEKVIRMMSHEINNSVGAVNSILNSSLTYRQQLASDDGGEFEEAIQVAIERNRRLNNFMANFADVVRIPLPVPEEHDIIDLLRSVQILMDAQCRAHNIGWVWDVYPEILRAQVDIQQLEQVLVNIVKNAIEAIGSDGTITVSVSQEEPYTLKFIDTGKGIAVGDRSRLFTPFFSTKRDGQGIGLTLIREILVNHGFRFNLESSAPCRTVFWIDFRRTV